MFRVFLNTLHTAILLPFYLTWGSRAAESQIDKMQEAAFNTPGAEAPLPPQVVAGGLLLLVSHILVGRVVLGLRFWQLMFSLVAGLAAGVGLFLWRRGERREP